MCLLVGSYRTLTCEVNHGKARPRYRDHARNPEDKSYPFCGSAQFDGLTMRSEAIEKRRSGLRSRPLPGITTVVLRGAAVSWRTSKGPLHDAVLMPLVDSMASIEVTSREVRSAARDHLEWYILASRLLQLLQIALEDVALPGQVMAMELGPVLIHPHPFARTTAPRCGGSSWRGARLPAQTSAACDGEVAEPHDGAEARRRGYATGMGPPSCRPGGAGFAARARGVSFLSAVPVGPRPPRPGPARKWPQGCFPHLEACKTPRRRGQPGRARRIHSALRPVARTTASTTVAGPGVCLLFVPNISGGPGASQFCTQ
ncbi:unnamed protein product, partial [Amoebophrya sp. A120]|eukprot:GSA120T00016967001.1